MSFLYDYYWSCFSLIYFLHIFSPQVCGFTLVLNRCTLFTYVSSHSLVISIIIIIIIYVSKWKNNFLFSRFCPEFNESVSVIRFITEFIVPPGFLTAGAVVSLTVIRDWAEREVLVPATSVVINLYHDDRNQQEVHSCWLLEKPVCVYVGGARNEQSRNNNTRHWPKTTHSLLPNPTLCFCNCGSLSVQFRCQTGALAAAV